MNQAVRYLESSVLRIVVSDLSLRDDRYTTVSMLTAQLLCEEELHLSFEQALKERLQQSSASLTPPTRFSSSVHPPQSTIARWALFFLDKPIRWRIVLVCLAFLLLLCGFDLMGLLVLFLR